MDRHSEKGRAADSIRSWLHRPRKKAGSNNLAWIGAAVGTAAGEVRTENQDRVIVARFADPANPERVFVAMLACDGMGGMVDGGVCAEIALSEFVDALIRYAGLPLRENLREAALIANQAVFREYRGRGGTTLTGAVFTSNSSAAVSVGDTRLYAVSPSKNVAQITVDDTIAGELQRIRGQIRSANELEPFSNRLAQFVGMGSELEPRTYELDGRGLWYLICTDGLQAVPQLAIERVVSAADNVHTLINRLIALSFWCGGTDNVSAICFEPDSRKLAPADDGSRYAGLEIWDPFTTAELIFVSVQPAVKATATAVPTITTESPSHAETSKPSSESRDWKKNYPPKSKRIKRTEAKIKKSRPQREQAARTIPKQFEMEIIGNNPPTARIEMERHDAPSKK